MIKKNNAVRPSLLVVTAFAMCFLLQAAQASTVSVGTPNCTNLVNFATIQLAVNAVPPGSTIKICPGNYPEQVVITKKLTLMGIPNATQDAVVISPPASGMVANGAVDPKGPVAAQILVQNTAGPVLISNLTVDGKGNQYSGDDLRGICYQDASGVVNHVAVRNEIPNDIPTGVQSGQGILVETISSSSANLTVENSSVHNYNKNGIVARYAGANLIATGNYVQGSGPIDVIAQNGIELAFDGATGSIKNNTVIDNFYTSPNISSSTDILLYDAKENGSIVVSGNTLGNSNYAVSLFTNAAGTYGDGVSVTTNKIFGTSTFDAIDVCTNGNIITGNTIFNSSESGIHLDASCGGTGTGNSVSANTILESACAGILTDAGTGTVGVNNVFYTVPFAVTSSTSSCSLPSTPARAKTTSKFKP